jgi:hypothetical protein
MKYFFDTEFQASRWSLELISIGIVSEDAREWYAWDAAALTITDPWLVANVIPKLGHNGSSATFSEIKNPDAMAKEIIEFIGDDPNPQFWAYYGAFDWVAFCGIFGGMMALPAGWPWTFRDLRVELDRAGLSHVKDDGRPDEHNALADARWVAEAHAHLLKIKGNKAAR